MKKNPRQVSFYLPEWLYKELKVYAATSDSKIKDVLFESICELLKKHRESGTKN